jgi:hypothetical protein
MLPSLTTNFYKKGLSIFFSKNAASALVFQKLAVLGPEESALQNFTANFDIIVHRAVVLNSFCRIVFLKKIFISHMASVKRRFFSHKKFKIRFLRKKFRLFRFLRGSI